MKKLSVILATPVILALTMVYIINAPAQDTNSKIYHWDGTIFTETQSIPTTGAHMWLAFSVGNEHYLALANYRNATTFNIDSKLYRWNGTSFIEFQSIPTQGALDWEYFTIGNNHYLAVANHDNDVTYSINSKIYKPIIVESNPISMPFCLDNLFLVKIFNCHLGFFW